MSTGRVSVLVKFSPDLLAWVDARAAELKQTRMETILKLVDRRGDSAAEPAPHPTPAPRPAPATGASVGRTTSGRGRTTIATGARRFVGFDPVTSEPIYRTLGPPPEPAPTKPKRGARSTA